jgi:predicted thioesterase
LALVSIDRMKGGGYHVAVESAAALEGGTAGRVAQAVASVEGRESPVKLEIRLVQRSKNE